MVGGEGEGGGEEEEEGEGEVVGVVGGKPIG